MQRLIASFRKLDLLGVLAGLAVLVSCGGRGASGHVDEIQGGDPDPADTPQAPPDSPLVDPADPPPPTVGGPPHIVEIPFLVGTSPPPSCIAGLPQRLPDCSPGVPYGIDCDGDGVWDYEVTNCDLSNAQTPSYFGGDFDCEPTNPTLKYWVTLDADGDGFGVGATLCAGPTIPAGYMLQKLDSEFDCDDDDANIHPHVPDIWGDGLDSDCENGDLPACASFVAGDSSFPHAARTSVDCDDEPDLYLSSLARCGSGCRSSGAVWGFVGNAGGASSPGPVRVSYRDSTGLEGFIEVTAGPLAPGAVSPLFELSLGRSSGAALRIEAADCRDDNNSDGAQAPGAKLCLQ